LSRFFIFIHPVRADVHIMARNDRRTCLSGGATIVVTW
jgi:hypothetical protein